MNVRNALMATMLALAFPAAADVVTVVEAIETTASNISVPVSNNSRLNFKPCPGTCKADFRSARLTPETRFVVNGQSMAFDEFRKAFINLRRGNDTYALVSYDTRSNTVSSVRISN